jgi:drug/metabolite transporter (DMT)-like permease
VTGPSLSAVPARPGILLMVLATFLWGATFVVIRDTVETVAPLVLVFARFGIAGLLYLPVIAIRRRPWSRPAFQGGVVSGAFTTGGYLFQAIGLETTSAGSSAFLTCAATLFAGFFAWPILGQRPPRVLIAGIAIALAGAALLTLRAGFAVGVGEAWTLLGAVCYAVQIVFVARYALRADGAQLVAVQSFTVALVLLPFAGAAGARVAALGATDWMRIGYLVVAGSMIAPLFQVLAQRSLPPGRIGLLFALEPVFALLFAASIGGEHFEWRWWIGALLILAALLLVEGHAARRERRQRRLSVSTPA